MKIDGALKGGIAGITTLGVLTNTLAGINRNSSHVNLMKKGKLKKRLKKTGSKNGFKATRQYIQLAEDILGSAAYLGINPLTKKKNIMLKGAVLGAAAGLGNVFLNRTGHDHSSERANLIGEKEDKLSTKLLEVSLYTIGGLIAGKVVENIKRKKKRKK